MDKLGYDDVGFNIYYKEVSKSDAEAIKIDSDILCYTVNTSDSLVTYLKGDEKNLYQYDISKDSKEKIASEVIDYKVSDDGKKIVYINSENSIYLKKNDKEKEKIASDVSSFEHLTGDFTTVYYTKDDSLYKQVEGKEKLEIASDVYDVIKIYDSGEVYYTTRKNQEISLMNYVNDDMKSTDDSITEPAYPNYPSSPNYPYRWNYNSYSAYIVAYEAYKEAYATWQAERSRMENEYNEACEVYNAKVSRDRMRASLEDKKLDQYGYSLCFYNGTKETVITDSLADANFYDYTFAIDEPVIVYRAYNQSNLEKVKLSEVESIYEIEHKVIDALFSSSDRYIAVKDSATAVKQEKEAKKFIINSSGTIVYYIDNISTEKQYGELYRISISKGVPGKAELYDNDVYVSGYEFLSDTEIGYFKDYKDSKGELYINKNKIDSDVKIGKIEFFSNLGKIFYFTDWIDSKAYGTLKVYDSKNAMKIADDVHSFSVTPDGRVLYLYDYSLNYYKGELHEWFNGTTRKIDDDVVCVLPIIYNKYRGYTYGW